MTDYPAWAEWAAWQWAVAGRFQKYIARDLGCPSGAVCVGITRFLAATYPELAVGELIYGETIRRLNTAGWGHRELAQRHFVGRLEPAPPADLTARGDPFVRRRAGRVCDPDERHAPRDVWLEFLPPLDPRLDNMVPVTWKDV